MTSDTRYVSWTWTPGIQPPTDILKLLHLQILFKTEGKMPSYLQYRCRSVCGKMPSKKKYMCTSKILNMESWNPIMESWNKNWWFCWRFSLSQRMKLSFGAAVGVWIKLEAFRAWMAGESYEDWAYTNGAAPRSTRAVRRIHICI